MYININDNMNDWGKNLLAQLCPSLWLLSFETLIRFLTKARGESLDATQEMLTLGLCNVVGSFFHSMPVTGSFSRSAVNNTSGVRTPLGGIYTGNYEIFTITKRNDKIKRKETANFFFLIAGILVILALSLLTPYFYYIPRATLSSVIVCAVVFMVEVNILRPIWKCSSEYKNQPEIHINYNK